MRDRGDQQPSGYGAPHGREVETWVESLAERVDSLIEPDSGRGAEDPSRYLAVQALDAAPRWLVQTETRGYLLDLTGHTLTRAALDDPPSVEAPLPRAQLRLDGEPIPLLAVLDCRIGHPLLLVLDVVRDGRTQTLRRTTPVQRIIPLQARLTDAGTRDAPDAGNGTADRRGWVSVQRSPGDVSMAPRRHRSPGILDLAVFDQEVWWVDIEQRPHRISQMSDEYITNVIAHLRTHAGHYYHASLRGALIQAYIDLLVGRISSEVIAEALTPLTDISPQEWLEGTPLMRALRRRATGGPVR